MQVVLDRSVRWNGFDVAHQRRLIITCDLPTCPFPRGFDQVLLAQQMRQANQDAENPVAVIPVDCSRSCVEGRCFPFVSLYIPVLSMSSRCGLKLLCALDSRCASASF